MGIEYLQGFKILKEKEISEFFEIHKDEFNPSLKKQVNIPSYSRKIFEKASWIIANDNNTDFIVGLCAFYNNQDIAYLTTIIVDQNYAGLGIGKKLLCLLFDAVGNKVIRLEVNKTNAIAIALYKKFGFKLIDNKKETMLMERRLNVPK